MKTFLTKCGCHGKVKIHEHRYDIPIENVLTNFVMSHEVWRVKLAYEKRYKRPNFVTPGWEISSKRSQTCLVYLGPSLDPVLLTNVLICRRI